MLNLVILGKFHSSVVLKQLIEKVDLIEKAKIAKVSIVLNSEDSIDLVDGRLKVHPSGMKGDVCSVLWEAVQIQDQTSSLAIVSTKTVLENPVELFDQKFESNDLLVACDEVNYAACKFDEKHAIASCPEFLGHTGYCLIFKRVDDFISAGKKIILAKKSVNGMFYLGIVANQFVLDNKSIAVVKL